MEALQRVKTWIGSLTEIGLMLLALAIVAALLVGANLPLWQRYRQHHDAGQESLVTPGSSD